MTTDDTHDRGVRYGIGGKVVAAHMDGDVRVIDQIDLQEVSMTTDDTRPLVHNHRPDEPPGLACPERLMGACVIHSMLARHAALVTAARTSLTLIANECIGEPDLYTVGRIQSIAHDALASLRVAPRPLIDDDGDGYGEREATCCDFACYEDPGCTCDGCAPTPNRLLDAERARHAALVAAAREVAGAYFDQQAHAPLYDAIAALRAALASEEKRNG
jgi:hypothetical protein